MYDRQAYFSLEWKGAPGVLCLEPSVEARLSGPGCALFVILLLLVYRAQKVPNARTQLSFKSSRVACVS